MANARLCFQTHKCGSTLNYFSRSVFTIFEGRVPRKSSQFLVRKPFLQHLGPRSDNSDMTPEKEFQGV